MAQTLDTVDPRYGILAPDGWRYWRAAGVGWVGEDGSGERYLLAVLVRPRPGRRRRPRNFLRSRITELPDGTPTVRVPLEWADGRQFYVNEYLNVKTDRTQAVRHAWSEGV